MSKENKKTKPEKSLTVPQVAEILGITSPTVIGYIEKWVLKAYILDKTLQRISRRIKQSDLDEFIANSQTT